MDLFLRNLSTDKPVHSVFTFSQFTLNITCSSTSATSISVSKWHSTQSNELTLEGPLAQWSTAAAQKLAPISVFDVTTQHVYASFQDRHTFATFPLTTSGGDLSLQDEPHPLAFNSELFAFACLPSDQCDGDGDSVFAISKTGQLALLRISKDNVCKQKVLDSLPLDNVLAVSTFRHNYVLVIGMHNSHATVCPLLFENDASFEFATVEQLASIRLPQPPSTVSKNSGESVLSDFYCDHNRAVLLYVDGTVHIIHPQHSAFKIEKRSFGSWGYAYGDSVNTTKQLANSKLVHEFRLSGDIGSDDPSSHGSRMRKSGSCSGGIVSMGQGYVAIGYGRCVSIWDLIYFVGHGLIKISSWVNDICHGPRDAIVLVGSESGLHEVSVKGADISIPLTLGLAMKRRGSCEGIIVKDISETVPLRSQPVIVAVTKTAAEAGGHIERLFRGVMDTLDTEEVRMVRALLSRELTSSAEAVARLTEEYTTCNKQVRRGNRGERMDLGLAKLPSERLAAASVARCLYEIHHGNAKYLVPLIDMLGTGVVSNEAVLAVVGLSDSWNVGPEKEQLNLLSIVDTLLSSETYCNALEAVVTRVSDLSEPDIVRVAQHVIHITQAEFAEDVNIGEGLIEKQSNDMKATLLSRGMHLLMKCMSAHGERIRLVESLRQIPFADVISLLSRLEDLLECSTEELEKKIRTMRAPRGVREGFFFGNSFAKKDAWTYRGVGDWMDKDDAKQKAKGKGAEVQGCIAWICHLLDAHLTNLIIDKSGRRLAKRLLGIVKMKQREYLMMKSLQGLSSHVAGRKPIPEQDAFYSSKMIEVPRYASLE